MIEAKSLCLLAVRGITFKVGESLGAHLPEATSPEALFERLRARRRLLLPAKTGSLLLFGDFIKETGLVLGVLLSASAEAIAAALGRLERAEIGCEDCRPCRLSFEEREVLCDRLCEIFHYVDRFFDRCPSFSIPALSAAIADFTGCRIVRASGSARLLELSAQSRAGLVFYLLCGMLTLRGRSGVLQVVGERRLQKSAFEIHVEVSELDGLPKREGADGSEPIFLRADCFSDVEWQTPDGRGTLDVVFSLQGPANALCATSAAELYVRMRLISNAYDI